MLPICMFGQLKCSALCRHEQVCCNMCPRHMCKSNRISISYEHTYICVNTSSQKYTSTHTFHHTYKQSSVDPFKAAPCQRAQRPDGRIECCGCLGVSTANLKHANSSYAWAPFGPEWRPAAFLPFGHQQRWHFRTSSSLNFFGSAASLLFFSFSYVANRFILLGKSFPIVCTLFVAAKFRCSFAGVPL